MSVNYFYLASLISVNPPKVVWFMVFPVVFTFDFESCFILGFSEPLGYRSNVALAIPSADTDSADSSLVRFAGFFF